MPLAPGARLGPHEIIGLLGAGGMGEVYRAHDTKLNRHVAIKVLPEAYAADPERLSRFQREAQAVAAFNHTGIAAIYDLADADGTQFLVLELIEGETLADRLARAPIPVEEALKLAVQMLEALEAAHEKGICHRDLKPANIKLTASGGIKVLDFGLAKFLQGPGTVGNLTHSPTLSLAGTYPGVILGTAGYMSPEQAKGFEADQRSDIFSFGCILYEMLTGRRGFEGETASEVLASVLKSEADLTALPPRLNPRLVEVLRRCLEKNPKKRWHSAADVRVEIESLAGRALVVEEPRVVTLPSRPLWRRVLIPVASAVVAATLAGYAAWTWKPEPTRTVGRFSVAIPEGQFFSNTSRRFITISPDGTRVAYIAGNRLYVRELSALDSRAIAGDGAQLLSQPTFSPDSQSIAFVVGSGLGGSGQIKRLAVSGGAPVTICEADLMFGMSWTEHGILLGQGAKGILRVAAEGGTPEVVVPAASDELLGSPEFLPGGRAVLFTAKKSPEGWDKAQIFAQRLDGGERKVLVTAGQDGRYLDTGHLVYVLGGVLLAQRLDPARLALSGGPVPVVEGVRRTVNSGSSGSVQMAVSRTGTLVFAPGQVTSDGPTGDLALFDRKGTSQALKLPAGTYRAPRVSRDGKFVTFESEDDKEAVVWVYDLSGARAMQRLTFTGRNRAPIWSPDGQWIAFQSDREGDVAIYRQASDGSGTPERLTKPDPGSEHIPQDWSSTGAHIAFTIRKDQLFTLAMLRLNDKSTALVPGVQSSALINAMFSPDGRWIAYQSRVDNRNVVFVEPFPGNGTKYQLPVGSAGHPTWSPKGDEILVNSAPQISNIVAVTTAPSLVFGRPATFRVRRGPSRIPAPIAATWISCPTASGSSAFWSPARPPASSTTSLS